MDNSHSKSRARILEVFRALVLSRPYDKITVQDIVEEADVARSTFYAHFTGKRTLLLASMNPLSEVLVKCIEGKASDEEIAEFASHCWENRTYGRSILQGDTFRLVSNALAESIQRSGALSQIESTAAAYGSFGALQCWLSGDIPATEAEVVTWLKSEGV